MRVIACLLALLLVGCYERRERSDFSTAYYPAGLWLAQIEAEKLTVPVESAARRFGHILRSLSVRSGTPPQDIADMSARAHRILREDRGKEIELVDLMIAAGEFYGATYEHVPRGEKIPFESVMAMLVQADGSLRTALTAFAAGGFAFPEARAAEEWKTIKKWSGEGTKETETFRTTKREWRVRWRASDEAFAGAGILQIFVHDEEGQMLSLAANKTGTGSDVSYVRSRPGGHYLAINSANVKWEIEVQERR